ncbi:fungal-specific transcription factor domain-containing protein [Venturia nashicola]|nr:fungal-specific transcription factor domain-containing protein [Venturia nashicola]
MAITPPGPSTHHPPPLSLIASAQQYPPTSFANLNFQPATDQTPQSASIPAKPTQLTDESVRDAAISLQQFSALRPDDPVSKATDDAPAGQSAMDEEAIVYSQTRMLQDPTGRLLYVGDSATLSFLQLIRMMVESVAGPSRFTIDPRRHKIMESQFSLESTARRSLLIPHKTTAQILADSFFTNTLGMVHVFNRDTFFRAIESTYAEPLSAEPTWLCVLNLVFAIGLMLATPAPGSHEQEVIDRLQQEHVDRAEVFYLNAKSLNDPINGLEDADFWSVQALLLMTVYMLTKSKRNTAFALLGMAIRSAYALGLHRDETLSIFCPEEQLNRQNVWRSLFVLDRFLSCSLGRPPGISEEDCGADMLKPRDTVSGPDDYSFMQAFPGATKGSQIEMDSLEAGVRSCQVIGTMLRSIYQQRKVSTKLAQDIANVCWEWPKFLNPSLEWKNVPTASPSMGIAIIHVNLLYCHSILLLSRPFFLFILNDRLQQTQPTIENGLRSQRNHAHMEKFTEACVISSSHTIKLVQLAYDAGYLPRRNPFITYFLFAAALIIMANEFAELVKHPHDDEHMRNSISIMDYCAKTDPQANRLLWILEAFRDVVLQQREHRARQQQEANQLPPFNLKANINPYGPAGDTLSPMTSATPIGQANVTLPSVTSPAIYPPQTGFRQDLNKSTRKPSASLTSPQRSISRTTQPMEPSLASPAPPNPLTPMIDRNLSFGNIFDFSALTGDRMGISGDSSGEDLNIDFDVLWGAWPSNPAIGTPKAGPVENIIAVPNDVRGVSDSPVPLFGVVPP